MANKSLRAIWGEHAIMSMNSFSFSFIVFSTVFQQQFMSVFLSMTKRGSLCIYYYQ